MTFDYDVTVRPIRNPQGKTVAFAQLIIDEQVQIDGFKIINGQNGLFVSAPQHKGTDKEGNDTYYDDVRFLGDKPEGVFRTPLQEEIYTAILAKYNEVSTTNSRGGAAAAAASAHGQHKLWP